MVRIAIQVRELISSNVSSALDGASNPANMLAHLQREIEEALVGLHGDIARARRQKDRLEEGLVLTRAQENDWVDKAKIAMDHGREDLARQALMAREECRARIGSEEGDISRLAGEISDMEEAERQLEAKREDVRERRANQIKSDAASTGKGAAPSRTERRMDRIDTLEKRTAFAVQDTDTSASKGSVERKIEEMQRERKVEEELAALREESAPKSAKKPAKKRAKRTKAA